MNFYAETKVGELVSRLSTDALIVGQSVSTNLTVGARAFMSFFGSAAIMVCFTIYTVLRIRTVAWKSCDTINVMFIHVPLFSHKVSDHDAAFVLLCINVMALALQNVRNFSGNITVLHIAI